MATQTGELVYHNDFGEEFRGASADDVVRSVYRSSFDGTGEDFTQWWTRQQDLWNRGLLKTIPPAETPEACGKLLQAFLKAGILLPGPLPAPSSTPGVSLG